MVFNVKNLDAAVAFYTQILGMKVIMRFEDRRMAFLSFGKNLGDIRLFEQGAQYAADRHHHGFNHAAFMPDGGADTLEMLKQRLTDNDVEIEAIETFAGGAHTGVYFRDPDNNRLEFYWETPAWVDSARAKVARAFGEAEPVETPEIELYAWPTSNGQKASIALEVMGIPYRVIPVPLGPGKERPEAMAEASETGKIPAIIDRSTGTTLCESGAILMYLAEKTNSPLLPSWGTARSAALQWLFTVVSTFHPAMSEGRFYLHMNPGKAPLAEKRVSNSVTRAYRIVEETLTKRAFLAGDAMTLADVAHWPYVARHDFHGIALSDYPATLAWYRRLAENPAFAKGFDLLGDGTTAPLLEQ
ncbi:MAG: glutathione S-transferase N-terminal domain-containing protein [Rhodobacteraceae bacterium]|nr:glutathione S-transferase N-terminal domain-containing protein [Paracoccaceae bacterium]